MEYLSKNENKQNNVLDVFFASVADGAIQSPITGATQLGNQVIRSVTGKEDLIPQLQLIEPPYQYKEGTSEWYAQQAGYGLGSAADLVVISALTRGRGSKAALLKEGSALSFRQGSKTALRNFAIGFGYEGTFRPIHEDEMDNFWGARFRNATVGGAFLSTLGASRGLCDIAVSKIQLPTAALRMVPKLGFAGASTLSASVVQAEATSLISNGELATLDELKSTAGRNLIAGLTMTRRPFILPPLEKTGLNVKQETDNFKRLAKIGHVGDFEENMATFEKRARDSGLSRQEVARTYHNLSKLLQFDRNPGMISPMLRTELATEALYQAANPTCIDQGNNNTCTAATADGNFYTTSPSDPIRMLYKLATRGRFTTHDGSTITLSQEQLQPDREALLLYPRVHGSGYRSYASQLFQLGAVNAHWQRQTKAPDGSTVPKGSIKYETTRPADPAKAPEEGLINTSVSPATRLTLLGRPINEPFITPQSLTSLERQITGKHVPNRILTRDFATTRDITNIASADQLGKQLSELKRDGGFPATITVYASAMHLLSGWPGLTCKDLSDNGGPHVLRITGYDEATGYVYVDGSDGNKNDFSGKPGEQKPLSKEDLFFLMGNAIDKTKYLSLTGQPIDDPSLKAGLARLPNLEGVHLNGTLVSNAGVAALAGRNELSSLSLSGTKIDDECAKSLSTLSKLTFLGLANTAIGDTTLQALTELKNLNTVDLTGTQATAKGVIDFAKKSGVKNIYLQDDLLSKEQLADLGAARADLSVFYGQKKAVGPR